MNRFDGFMQDVEAASEYQQRGCGVGKLLKDLLGDEADSVQRALDRPELTASAIEKSLKGRVKTVPSAYTIGRHRRADCGCEKA